MNLSIQDGRAELWQWDTGVRLVMDEACEAVNLSEDTFGVTVDVTAAEDGKTWVAAVPDEMLQKPGDLICYAVQSTATGTITAAYRSFRVNRRPKPAGYVATPTEARTWQELDDKKIDAPQTAAVGEVLTVEEVDAEGKPKKWKTAPGIRGEKGDTGPAGPKGDTGPVGPKGADGKDGAGMDVTGAKVGQIAKITAVDAAGKPTAWEPVDMPSGGTYTLPIASPTVLGGVKPIAKTDAMTQGVGVDEAGALWTAALGGSEIWEEVYSATIEEETTTFDADLGANYKKIIIAINATGAATISANRTIKFIFNQYDKNVFGNGLMSSAHPYMAYCIEVYDAFILSRRMQSYLERTVDAQPFSGNAGMTGIGNRAALIRDNEPGINHINMSTLSSFAFQTGEVIKVYGVLT